MYYTTHIHCKGKQKLSQNKFLKARLIIGWDLESACEFAFISELHKLYTRVFASEIKKAFDREETIACAYISEFSNKRVACISQFYCTRNSDLKLFMTFHGCIITAMTFDMAIFYRMTFVPVPMTLTEFEALFVHRVGLLFCWFQTKIVYCRCPLLAALGWRHWSGKQSTVIVIRLTSCFGANLFSCVIL